MHKDRIKKMALGSGFKLKEQPNGEMDLNPYVYRFADMVESAISHKYESERKDRWIRTKDRLPSESGKYLVCYGDGHVILENFMTGVNMFYACHSDIMYWSEIPEPPEGLNNEKERVRQV